MQEHNYSIKHWSKDDRPREKLLYSGAANLSNSELLAILIHNGTRQKTAVDLAKEILKMDSKAARWIASDAIRELTSESVQKRLKP